MRPSWAFDIQNSSLIRPNDGGPRGCRPRCCLGGISKHPSAHSVYFHPFPSLGGVVLASRFSMDPWSGLYLAASSGPVLSSAPKGCPTMPPWHCRKRSLHFGHWFESLAISTRSTRSTRTLKVLLDCLHSRMWSCRNRWQFLS